MAMEFDRGSAQSLILLIASRRWGAGVLWTIQSSTKCSIHANWVEIPFPWHATFCCRSNCLAAIERGSTADGVAQAPLRHHNVKQPRLQAKMSLRRRLLFQVFDHKLSHFSSVPAVPAEPEYDLIKGIFLTNAFIGVKVDRRNGGF